MLHKNARWKVKKSLVVVLYVQVHRGDCMQSALWRSEETTLAACKWEWIDNDLQLGCIGRGPGTWTASARRRPRKSFVYKRVWCMNRKKYGCISYDAGGTVYNGGLCVILLGVRFTTKIFRSAVGDWPSPVAYSEVDEHPLNTLSFVRCRRSNPRL